MWYLGEYVFPEEKTKQNKKLISWILTVQMLDHLKFDHSQHENKTAHSEVPVLCLSKAIDVEPLTDVISSMNMRSCLMFPRATVAHSGNYICHVHEGVQDQTASASVNITVLG